MTHSAETCPRAGRRARGVRLAILLRGGLLPCGALLLAAGTQPALGATVEDGLRKLYSSAGGALIWENTITFNGRVCKSSVYTWKVRSMALGFIAGALRREYQRLTRAAAGIAVRDDAKSPR